MFRSCHVRSCFSRLIVFYLVAISLLCCHFRSTSCEVSRSLWMLAQTHHLVFLARSDVASLPSLSPCQICFALVWDFTRLSLYSWCTCHYWSVLWPGFRLPILDTFASWTIDELFVSFITCVLLKPLVSVSFWVNLHFVPSSFKSRVGKKNVFELQWKPPLVKYQNTYPKKGFVTWRKLHLSWHFLF